MDAALEAFKAEASKTKEGGRVEATCVALAETYVQGHTAELEARFGHLTLEQMVEEVTHYRNVGREEDLWKAEAWLRAYFAPQKIGGSGNATVDRRRLGKGV